MTHNHHFPLAEIVETKTYPHARTLRTSFSQKLWDTYNAIAGKPPILAHKPHVGVFDYLTLYIPTGFVFLMRLCLENAGMNLLAAVLSVPVILINIPFLIARVAFGVVATLLFSPIIAIVHNISRIKAGQSHTEALSLQGRLKNGVEQSLGDYLTQHHIDIEELDITIKKSSSKEEGTSLEQENHSSSYQLMFWKKVTGPSEGLICAGCLNGGCDDNHAPFSVEIRQEKGAFVTQKTNIHALFKLNVGDVVSNIEETDITDKSAILAI